MRQLAEGPFPEFSIWAFSRVFPSAYMESWFSWKAFIWICFYALATLAYVVFRLNHPILINMIFPTHGNIFMSTTHVDFYHTISVWFCLDMDMDFNLSSAAKPQGGNFSCHSVEGHQNDTSFCSSTALKSSMPASVIQPNCWLAVICIKWAILLY